MIALLASLLLGLYILLPVLVFERALAFFVPVKKITRTRTEEVAFGATVVFLPLALAWILCHSSYFVGHHPFPLNETAAQTQRADYRTAITALQSDHYFEANNAQVWDALEHIKLRQARFLFWTYLFLVLECTGAILLMSNYGRLRKWRLYRWISAPLFKRVSPWHILFTTYTFPPSPVRQVHLDVLLNSGELVTGVMGPGNYIENPDGSLSAILLVQTKRYKRKQLEEDRQNGVAKPKDEYWSVIAGDGQFFIPAGVIVDINIRFRIPEETLKTELSQEIAKALRDVNIETIEITLTKPRLTFDEETPEAAQPGSPEPTADAEEGTTE